MKTIMTIIGTRPEAIKLAPIIAALRESKYFKNIVCISGQHTDLVDSLLVELGITVDYQIENHKNDGSLNKSASYMLEQFSIFLKEIKPDLVIVQGDTTTAFAGALAAFYLCIPVAHIEAGLRTGNLYSPWPEEAHRCLIDKLTTYFFTPTEQARNSLVAEGARIEKIWVVGNTSIDAIRLIRETSKANNAPKQKIIVVTVHRRENHGNPLTTICHALLSIAKEFADIKIIFCLHPNPAIHGRVTNMLSNIHNIDLVPPMSHNAFVKLLVECIFIITDSGGIQEEASFMGKPILIVRDTTERPEGIVADAAMLVGTASSDIITSCRELLYSKKKLSSMSKVHFPYGDGYAAQRIVNILELEFCKELT